MVSQKMSPQKSF